MKNLKFIHITKTAGTSIENAAILAGIQWGRFDTEYTLGVTPEWHKPFVLLNDKKLKYSYDWFTVIRNPYTRIISEFYCKWITPKDKNVNILDFNRIIRDNISNRNKSYLGYHYTEQHLYIDHDPNINLHIVKFENLYEEFDQLMNKYNLNIRLEKIIRPNKKYSVDDLDEFTIKMINSVYRNDFSFFGYARR